MIAEAVTGLAVYVSPSHAAEVGTRILDSRALSVTAVEREDMAAGIRHLRRYDLPGLSLQDTVAFAVIERLRADLVFGVDHRHFEGVAGLEVVPSRIP